MRAAARVNDLKKELQAKQEEAEAAIQKYQLQLTELHKGTRRYVADLEKQSMCKYEKRK